MTEVNAPRPLPSAPVSMLPNQFPVRDDDRGPAEISDNDFIPDVRVASGAKPSHVDAGSARPQLFQNELHYIENHRHSTHPPARLLNHAAVTRFLPPFRCPIC